MDDSRKVSHGQTAIGISAILLKEKGTTNALR